MATAKLGTVFYIKPAIEVGNLQNAIVNPNIIITAVYVNPVTQIQMGADFVSGGGWCGCILSNRLQIASGLINYFQSVRLPIVLATIDTNSSYSAFATESHASHSPKFGA